VKLALCFTNFGPYHLARLRALARELNAGGGSLVAYEIAGTQEIYPWTTDRGEEPFRWTTLFPDRVVEAIPGPACAREITRRLDHDQPDAVAAVGYARPESMALLRWARREGRPAILMSESQAIDHPRVWWKEAIKRRRVRAFSAALVGGPAHREYLVSLGMPRQRIALGYNAVDNDHYAREAARALADPEGGRGMPSRPYFLAVNRFVPEKNLARLIEAFALYRSMVGAEEGWDLVLCGSGPGGAEVEAAVQSSGLASAIHRPGFLQAGELSRWYGHASAFVHPSLMEPWGLVVNEAAACGLPLLVSDRAGCAETLVTPETGRQFDPHDVEEMAGALAWMAGLPEEERRGLGRRAKEVVARWGPERFALGTLEALMLAAQMAPRRRIASTT
jgi:glycosyltransferase involved in cell wall biosynthesis